VERGAGLGIFENATGIEVKDILVKGVEELPSGQKGLRSVAAEIRMALKICVEIERLE